MDIALVLGLVAAVAGFVDAIAGGGGLLTVPALLSAGLPPEAALGTNKGQSVFASGMALSRFAHSPLLDRRRAGPTFVWALLGATGGVWLLFRVPSDILKPIVLGLLVAVAVLLLLRRPQRGSSTVPRQRPWWMAAGVALPIGAYDGFFGPGTGTFAIMAYVGLWGDPMDAASANAKVLNFASNLAAMLTFAIAGTIVWPLAFPMIVGGLIGGFLGAQFTIRRGQGVVRIVVIAISLLIVAKLGLEMAGVRWV